MLKIATVRVPEDFLEDLSKFVKERNLNLNVELEDWLDSARIVH